MAGEYARLYEQFTLSQDAYSVAQERRRVGDEAIEAVLNDICKRKTFLLDNIAVIARGSYGLGHLCSNSDVDITFIHGPNDKEKAEAEEIYKELRKILKSGWGHIMVRPLINTIDECASHWDSDHWNTDFSSFSSFASSRIIVGSSELHQDLRRKWIYHVQQTDLREINEGIKKQRLKYIIEDQQGNITNIKTCAGGLMDIVHIFLLEEVLSIKGIPLLKSFIRDSYINDSFRFLLNVREHIYAINKTLAMTKSDISRVAQLMTYNQSQGINSTEFWALLMDHRKKIRDALLSLLST